MYTSRSTGLVILKSSDVFSVMCKLEGKSWKEAVEETKQKFITTFEVYAHWD